MSTFQALRLDGANPLHALAALGLLRLGDRLNPGLRMAWARAGGAWRPVYAPVTDAARWLHEVAAALRMLAALGQPDPARNRRVRELATHLKKATIRRKDAEKVLKAQATVEGWARETRAERVRAALEPITLEIDALQRDLNEAEAALQAANGLGLAHAGDAIGIDAAAFRRLGHQALALWPPGQAGPVTQPADAPLLVAQWPALGCDAVAVQGKVVPTPYSFSNGSGGQYLLKDFRACASRVTTALLEASLTGAGQAAVDDVTSLNWDPADQVSHALVWQDPQDRKKSTDVAANALAYLGLSLLPTAPGRRGLQAVAWAEAGGFVWPIWSAALGIDAVSSLLASMPLRAPWPVQDLRARGVVELRLAAKVNPDGQRNFFAPSRPLA